MHFLLYTILFTVPGQDPKKNEYIWIFFTWLASIVYNKVLEKEDELYICIDEETRSFIQKQVTFNNLVFLSPFKYNYYIIEKPQNVLEGFFNKYSPECISTIYSKCPRISDTIVIYSDVDNMFAKPIRSLEWTNTKNTLYPILEGSILDSLHLGAYIPTTDEENTFSNVRQKVTSDAQGFGAGLFAFSFESEEKVIHLFNQIYKYKNNISDKSIYYEQGVYNFICLLNQNNNSISLHNPTFNIDTIAFNNPFVKDAHIYSFMGDAGNGTHHMDKCMGYIVHKLLNLKP